MAVYNDEKWLEWIDILSDSDLVVIDDFLPSEMYAGLKYFFSQHLASDDFSKAGIGAAENRQIQTSVRGDYIYWISRDKDGQLSGIFSLLDELVQKLNRFCFLSLSGYEFHLAFYPKGSFYKKHIDQFKGRNNRMISVIIYLNDDWKQGDGGELGIIREDGSEHLIAPLANRCVMFKSDSVEHEVLETHTGRQSLTGWLLYQPQGLGQILG